MFCFVVASYRMALETHMQILPLGENWERRGSSRLPGGAFGARVLARGVLDGAPRRRSKPVDLCSRAFSVLFSDSLSSAEVAEVAEVWKLGADVANSRPPIT